MTYRVGRTHSDGGLPSAWLASNQHCSSSYVAIFDHLQNDSGCPTRGQLTDQPLRHLQGTETTSTMPGWTSVELCTSTYYWKGVF